MEILSEGWCNNMKIRKKSDEPRDTVLTIRLSKSEQQELKRLAAAAGVSVGGFLLGKALGDAIGKKVIDSIEQSKKNKP
jgi:uncharacterized protein (DUF1778 family)